jgi:hypothetical protein
MRGTSRARKASGPKVSALAPSLHVRGSGDGEQPVVVGGLRGALSQARDELPEVGGAGRLAGLPQPGVVHLRLEHHRHAARARVHVQEALPLLLGLLGSGVRSRLRTYEMSPKSGSDPYFTGPVSGRGT